MIDCLWIRFTDEAPFATESGLQVTEVASLPDVLQYVGDNRFDAVILEVNGLASVTDDQMAQLRERGPDAPILLVTASGNESEALHLIRSGAQDVLVRSQLTDGALQKAIRCAGERHRQVRAFRNLAFLDDLTGLYNRRGFLAIAEQHLKLAQRSQRPVLLFFIDLNGLKEFNDRHGHAEGDRALIQAADVLRTTFRTSDVLARIGGDEFTVLAIDVAESHLPILNGRLERILQTINAQGRLHRPVSMSVGVAAFDPAAGSPSNVEELLAAADRRMYRDRRVARTAPD